MLNDGVVLTAPRAEGPLGGPLGTPSSPGGAEGPALETIWEGAHARSIWQRLTVAFLALIAAVCVHYFMYHLHAILLPFFLSGFVVFALQPSVEATYRALAGLSPPHRWLICGLRRRSCPRQPEEELERAYGSCCLGGGRQSKRAMDLEARREAEPLLEKVPTVAVMFCEAICRFLAVSLALLFLLLVASLFFILLGHGAMHMKDNWSAYHAGLRRLQGFQDHVIDRISKELHMEAEADQRLKDLYDKLLDQAQALVWTMVNEIAAGVSEGVSQLLIVMLYVMFWLMQPLPTAGQVSSVVRSYLLKKSLVSFLYGGCVALLFWSLAVDLALFFGVVSFFLNFVPEVGALISMLVPVPVILLDGRQESPLLVLACATAGQLVLKFLIGNILEVKLIESDKEMNIHPVWIILGLSYFGFVWGPMGALLSVPLLAMVKMAALSVRGEQLDAEAVVPALAETFLACFEGRQTCWARPGKEATEARESARSPPRPPTPPGPSTPLPGSSPVMASPAQARR